MPTPSFLSFSPLCVPLVQDFPTTINACSANAAKQYASTIIWEEISKLRNNIRVYENQILAWKHEIVSWKTRQNTLCDVARLPDDILLEIWSYFAEVAAQSPDMQREWLWVTQVCSRWRALALNTQSLWRWPCIMLPDIGWRLLERAQSNPISLLIDVGQIANSSMPMNVIRDTFSLANRLLCQAESLSLKGPNTLRPSWIADCEKFMLSLTQSGPHHGLTSLSVEYDDSPSQPQMGSEPDVCKLILSAPSLTNVILDNISMLNLKSYKPTQVPPITFLDIRLEKDTPHQISISQGIQTIEILPSLQSLTLVDTFIAVTHEDREWSNRHPSPLLLGNLKMLWVASDEETLEFFFRHISYTPPTEVTLEFTGDTVHSTALRPLMDATTNDKYLSPPLRDLEISISEEDDEFPSYFCGLYASSDSDTPRLSFILKLETLSSFCNPLYIHRFQQLETLWFTLDETGTEIWETFGTLPHLKCIKDIEIDDNPTLMKVLASFRPSGDSLFEPFTANNVGTNQTSCEIVLPIPPASLYFPQLERIERSGHAPINEEMMRIMKVRKSWM